MGRTTKGFLVFLEKRASAEGNPSQQLALKELTKMQAQIYSKESQLYCTNTLSPSRNRACHYQTNQRHLGKGNEDIVNHPPKLKYVESQSVYREPISQRSENKIPDIHEQAVECTRTARY